MRAALHSSLVVGLALLGACQPTHLPADALADYVADPSHHLRQVQRVGNTEVGVTYQPLDLLVARDAPNNLHSQVAIDSLRHKYQGSTFFLLSLSRNGQEVLQPKAGFADYSELLQTLAFRMGEHVQLITSQGDTLRPSNYYLDRTYASANASQLLFAFPKLPSSGTWRFRIQEFGLATGNLSFLFEAPLVLAAPSLALD